VIALSREEVIDPDFPTSDALYDLAEARAAMAATLAQVGAALRVPVEIVAVFNPFTGMYEAATGESAVVPGEKLSGLHRTVAVVVSGVPLVKAASTIGGGVLAGFNMITRGRRLFHAAEEAKDVTRLYQVMEGVLAARKIRAKTWQEYERGVRALYGDVTFTSRQYSAVVNGKLVNGVADNVAEIAGKRVAIEAKFLTDAWARSPRNPSSSIGHLPFAVAEQTAMLDQAKKYSAAFDEVIYHSNSTELIAHYTKVFKGNGITNFKFIFTE
jgi:hypothetical protein